MPTNRAQARFALPIRSAESVAREGEIADLVLEGLSTTEIVARLIAAADADSSDPDLIAGLAGLVATVRTKIHADLLTFILSPDQDPGDDDLDLGLNAPGGLA